jgi:hypothetical protein
MILGFLVLLSLPPILVPFLKKTKKTFFGFPPAPRPSLLITSLSKWCDSLHTLYWNYIYYIYTYISQDASVIPFKVVFFALRTSYFFFSFQIFTVLFLLIMYRLLIRDLIVKYVFPYIRRYYAQKNIQYSIDHQLYLPAHRRKPKKIPVKRRSFDYFVDTSLILPNRLRSKNLSL